jgi:hypothetical protein
MKTAFYGIIILAIAAAFTVYGLGYWTQSSADYEYQRAAGQALIIEAQGQARLDSAQATAITSAAMLPWLIVFCISVLATVAVVFLLRQPPVRAPLSPPLLVERHYFFLPQTNRVETWRQIGETERLLDDSRRR